MVSVTVVIMLIQKIEYIYTYVPISNHMMSTTCCDSDDESEFECIHINGVNYFVDNDNNVYNDHNDLIGIHYNRKTLSFRPYHIQSISVNADDISIQSQTTTFNPRTSAPHLLRT